MPERAILVRAGLAILAVTAVSLLFVASYAGALHEPRPHDVPVAVDARVPAAVAAGLDRSSAVQVDRVDTAADALRRIDERDAYGAVVADRRGLLLVVAPAAGPSVADVLREGVTPALRRTGATVRVAEVHRLPDSDSRGLVGFYLAVGWVVGAYLGASFLGLIFGERPGWRHTVWRLGALAVLALAVGLSGAVVGSAIGGFGGSVLLLGLVGALCVMAVGSVTLALMSALGLIGIGVSILIFVVLGNPSSGGPFESVLLPGLWRETGPAIPTGAVTTAIRDIAYFPDASIAGPVLVMLAWLVVGVVAALALGRRRGPFTDEEAAASMTAASAP